MEKFGDHPTNMLWTTEKDIRLFMARQIDSQPKRLQRLYDQLEQVRSAQRRNIRYDVQKKEVAEVG